MEAKFTEKESLSLISEMITQARNNLQRHSGTAMVFNGYLVALTAILNIVLIYILPDPRQSFWVWLLMIPGFFADRFIDRNVKTEAHVRTHIDVIVQSAWRSFGFATLLFLAIIFGFAYAMSEPDVFILITPMILMMAGIAEYISAKACRFKPLLIGSYVLWGGALACLLCFAFLRPYSGVTQFLILAICVILAFVIPGHKLNKLAEKNV